MKQLVIAKESAENIAELIEAHSLSSHMQSIAHDIRGVIEEAGELGYVVVSSKSTTYGPCACGCGRLCIANRIGRRRQYFSVSCRKRASRERKRERERKRRTT